MRTTTDTDMLTSDDKIANLAKQIWEREGRQAGRDLEYWLRAERQVRSSRNTASKTPLKPSKRGTTQSQAASKTIRLPDSIGQLVQTK